MLGSRLSLSTRSNEVNPNLKVSNKKMLGWGLLLNIITIISLKGKNTYEMEGHQDNIQPVDYNEYQPINP